MEQPVPTNDPRTGRWLDASALAPLAPCTRAWLTWPRMLTAAVRASCRDAFALDVIGERSCTLRTDERALLGVSDAAAHEREILMRDGGEALLYARTLVPATTLARQPWLSELGDAPLGEALAARAGDGARDGFRFQPVASDWPLLGAGAPAPMHGAWARSSVVRVAGAPLAIIEVFLPALHQRPAP